MTLMLGAACITTPAWVIVASTFHLFSKVLPEAEQEHHQLGKRSDIMCMNEDELQVSFNVVKNGTSQRDKMVCNLIAWELLSLSI